MALKSVSHYPLEFGVHPPHSHPLPTYTKVKPASFPFQRIIFLTNGSSKALNRGCFTTKRIYESSVCGLYRINTNSFTWTKSLFLSLVSFLLVLLDIITRCGQSCPMWLAIVYQDYGQRSSANISLFYPKNMSDYP